MALTDGLLGYWQYDEASGDLADASGNGLTMTASGLTYAQTGKILSAIDWDGVASSTRRTNPTTLNMGAGATRTVAGWFKPATLVSGMLWAKRYGNTGANGWYIKTTAAGKIEWFFADGTDIVNDESTSAVFVADTWAFVALTWTLGASSLVIKVNDSAVSGGARDLTAVGAISTTNDFCIGNSFDSDTTTLQVVQDGIFDDGGIWNRVLSDAELTSLYNGGAGTNLYPSAGTSGSSKRRNLSLLRLP